MLFLQLRYPDSTSNLETSLDNVMNGTINGYQYSKVIQFSTDESSLKVKRSTASLTFGVFVHFIMVNLISHPNWNLILAPKLDLKRRNARYKSKFTFISEIPVKF